MPYMTYERAKNILNETSRIPYPQITYIEKNANYAKMLFDDYAGTSSELTAIMQYMFQFFDVPKNTDVAKIMLEISNVEMYHFKMLGELIKQLGATPYYISSSCKPWISSNTRYDTRELIEMLQYNIAAFSPAMLYCSISINSLVS